MMDRHEAKRCVRQIAHYLRTKEESPRAGADLLEAVEVLSIASAPALETPTGSCLLCGHLRTFAVFTNGHDENPLNPRWIGVCEQCRRAASASMQAKEKP